MYPHACIRCICTVVASLILVHTRFWPTLLLYMHDFGQPYSCTCTVLANPTLVYARFWPALLLYMHGSGQPYSCTCTILASPTLVHARFWPTLLLYMHDSGQPYSCIACDYLVHSTNFSQDQIHISCAVFAAGRYVPMCVYNTYTPIHMGIYLSI